MVNIYRDHTGLPKHYLAVHDQEVHWCSQTLGSKREYGKRLVEEVAKQAPFVSEEEYCCMLWDLFN